MKTIKRTCVRDYVVTGMDKCKVVTFKLSKGEEYLTSQVNVAAACHGPEPEEGNVVVFSKYWVSVPVHVFVE